MKKNFMFAILVICLFIFVFSFNIFFSNNSSKYEFNEKLTKEELLHLESSVNDVTVCDNCIYTGSNWEEKPSSSLLSVKGTEYEKIDDYDMILKTGVDVSIGDYYKKVLAYYGIDEQEAYWNIEYKNGDVEIVNYPTDEIDRNDVKNAYLVFVYYPDGDDWKLLSLGRYKYSNGSISNLDEYVRFTFEFAFNGESKYNRDKTLAAYSIYHYKK